MKIKLVLLSAMLATLNLSAQTARESVGVGAPGGGVGQLTPDEQAKFDHNLHDIQAMMEHDAKAKLPSSEVFRVVNGTNYNVINSRLWHPISGKVNNKTDDGLLILRDVAGYYGDYTSKIALKNYSGNGVSGQNISAVAIHVGTYNWGDQPLELWDCGMPHAPPPPTPEQIAAVQKATLREHQKVLEGQTNAVHWLLSQATNGDASAQCSLSEHYLNGQGCATNREQAVYWLQQAAAQGYVEASNKLTNLQK